MTFDPANVHLGKQPYRDDPRTLRLAHYINFAAALPHIPAHWTWSSHVAGWPMYLNDRIGDCVAPETRILTESLEWVPAGSLLPGDKLLGFDEEARVIAGRKAGRWFTPATVERADIVIRPCYELEFSDGTVVRSSAGHRWLTRSTVQGKLGCQVWARTEDLRAEAPRQTHVVKSLDTWSEDRSWDAGYLAAAFDGEGHVEQWQRANRVAVSQTANAMLDQIELSLKTLGFDYHHEINNRHKTLRVDGSARKDLHCLRIGTRRDFLRFMGEVRPRRLLANYSVASLGRIPGDVTALVRKTYIGEQPVVMLDTSSRTYFAEGLASHNCTCAEVGHHIELWTAAAGHQADVADSDILGLYEKVSGYDPASGRNDNGAVILDVLNRWRHDTVAGHTIGAFCEVDHTNRPLLETAVYLFGGLSIGIAMPQAAQHMGSYWHRPRGPLTGSNEPGSWGGHCVFVCDYNRSGVTVVTWGQLVHMTWGFWDAYVDEAWCAISNDFLAGGRTPQGFDLAALQADLAAVGQVH